MTRSAPRRLMSSVLAGLAALFIGASALAYATPRLKPPAPGPEYLSRADHTLLLGVAEALKRKRFAEAKAQTALIADPVAKSLGTWMYFMAQDPDVSLAEADAFLDAHSDWPMVQRMQAFVEGRISSDAPAGEVLAFFDSRDAASGDGKIAFARALLATGNEEVGEFQLRDAWINHNFTVAEERRILSAFGGRLREEDHAARVDRLLWGRQVTNARRVMSRLSAHERKKATARAALLMRAADGPRLYGDLARTDQLDPGVLHAAVRYYRRTGNEPTAVSLSREAPDDPVLLRNPESFWYERQLLMRWALKEGRFAEAYEIAAHHGLDGGSDLAEAEFNAGWIALRFLGQPARAETHFLALASAVGAPISLARAYYWTGRAKAAQGELADARIFYDKAARHYYSFYGQLAAEEIGGDALLQHFGPPAVAGPDDKALFSSRPTAAALRMLADLNFEYEFMVFAYHVDDQLERPGEYAELAQLANGEGAPHLTVRAGKAAVQRGAFAPDVAYPLIFVPDDATRYVSPEIILGLSRQESEFNPRAYSSAGARGVMQLIPSTALLTARKEGLRYSRSGLLDDPVYNITIGSAHLSHLAERFDGSLVMAFAAYNAGVNRVERWVEDYGDPRSGDIDPLDWIELIPFSETRNYVQRVLENIQVYRGRLNGVPIPGRLTSDIERGGAGQRVARAANASISAASLGALPIAPLPERTAARVEAFKLALAVAEAQSGLAAVNPPAPEETARAAGSKSKATSAATDRRGRRAPRERNAAPAETPPASNPVLTEEPAPEKTENPAPGAEEKAVEPAPIALSSTEPGSPPLSDDVAAQASVDGADATDAALEQLAITARALIEIPQAASVEENEEILEAAGATIIDGAAPDAMFAELDDPDDLNPMDECLTYRDFLARNAEEEAAAADLNAGMLAELQSGGGACE